jgi:hypothetical protein
MMSIKYPIHINLIVTEEDLPISEKYVAKFVKSCDGRWIFIGRENFMIARWLMRLVLDGTLNHPGEYHLEIRSRLRAAGHWHKPEKIEVIMSPTGVMHTPN